MPIKVKYVGPLDFKTFRDYTFVRDITDDASATTGKPGENAVELPDNVANEALKHREVFMQWNQPVPEKVKALRLARPDALEQEGKDAVSHWNLRLAVAMMLPDDTKRKAEMKAGEMAGAQAQIDRAQGLITQAHLERAKARREAGLNVDDAEGTSAIALQASLDQLAGYQEAITNANTENQAMRAELLALKAQMERDGRLTPDEAPSAPNLGSFGVAVTVTQTPETTDDVPGDFEDIFAPEATAPKPGRKPKS